MQRQPVQRAVAGRASACGPASHRPQDSAAGCRTTLTAMTATTAPANSRVSGVSRPTKADSSAAARLCSVSASDLAENLPGRASQHWLGRPPSKYPFRVANSRLSGSAASRSENASSLASTPGANCTSGLPLVSGSSALAYAGSHAAPASSASGSAASAPSCI